MSALQNSIQEIDHNEGTIPTDPYQAAYTPFPSGIGNDDDSGFIAEDEEESSEVKLRRKNIANEMWKSYLNYIADAGAGSSDDDFSDLSE